MTKKTSTTEDIVDFGYDNTLDTIDCKVSEPFINEVRIFNDKYSNNSLRDKLRIGTYNVWGIEKFKYSFLEKRLPHIINTLLKNDVEVWCLQEVSKQVLTEFESNTNITQKYAFSCGVDDIDWDYSGVVTLILTQILPNKGKIFKYRLIGEQNYHSTMIQLGQITIVTVHLQAGSSSSAGVAGNAEKYSKCRSVQIKQLFAEINKQSATDKLIFLGDMNIHMDGDTNKWPELIEFQKQNLKDAWRIIKPYQTGFTEDTKKNSMRWNIKQKEKRARYDIVTYKGDDITVGNINIIGNKKVFDIEISEFEPYYKKLGLTEEMLVKNSKGKLDWFGSDHFGLIADIYLDFN